MESLIQDLRFAVRTLARNRSFTVFVILILALGIGANTALFSVVNAVVLRPLDYDDSDRLVDLRSNEGEGSFPVSLPNFEDWQRQSQSFEAMSIYTVQNVNLTGLAEAQRIKGVSASAAFFEVLRARPLLGRTWSSADTNEPGVVLSEGLWRTRFGADRDLIGRTIGINGGQRPVLGVMPASFRFADADAWAFMPPNPTWRRSNFYGYAVARLKSGVSLKSAQAEADAIGTRLGEQYPNQGVGARVESLQRSVVGNVKRPLFVLLGAVALVLLIACANIASLLLARAEMRRREMAVRASLGAGRSRLVRQLLTEACLLSLAAGVAGVLLAAWGTDALVSTLPAGLPRAQDIGIDGVVLLFAFGISLITGLAFGITPALRSSRGSLLAEMLEGGRATTAGSRGMRTRRILVVAEIALALVPLVGAGLLLKSFQRLTAVDSGYSPEHVLTASYALPGRVYSPERVTAYADRLLEQVTRLPGVQSAGVITPAPLSSENQQSSFDIVGQPPATGDESKWTQVHTVTPGYFNAVGIQLLRGRPLLENDRANAPRVALVDDAFVRRFFRGREVIGQRVAFGFDREHPWEIVGVVGNVRHTSLSEAPEPNLYFPYAQLPIEGASIFVRTRSDPAHLASALSAAGRAVDRDIPLYGIRTFEQVVAASVAQQRFNALLLGSLGVSALLIAAIGIYAVLSHTVAERKREIGIRVALGARPGDVERLIVGEGARMALLGVVTGSVLALGLGRVVNSLLYDVTAYDPATLASMCALLGAVALIACYIPARRAARLDPTATLTEAQG